MTLLFLIFVSLVNGQCNIGTEAAATSAHGTSMREYLKVGTDGVPGTFIQPWTTTTDNEKYETPMHARVALADGRIVQNSVAGRRLGDHMQSLRVHGNPFVEVDSLFAARTIIEKDRFAFRDPHALCLVSPGSELAGVVALAKPQGVGVLGIVSTCDEMAKALRMGAEGVVVHVADYIKMRATCVGERKPGYLIVVTGVRRPQHAREIAKGPGDTVVVVENPLVWASVLRKTASAPKTHAPGVFAP